MNTAEAIEPSLFVYGLRLFGEVLDRLIGRRPEALRAAAPGYAVRLITGEVYPGLILHDSSAAGGLLLTDLTDAELAALDEYEGDLYWHQSIQVVDDRGSVREALTYLVDEQVVGEEVWTSHWFAEHHLAAYVSAMDATPSVL